VLLQLPPRFCSNTPRPSQPLIACIILHLQRDRRPDLGLQHPCTLACLLHTEFHALSSSCIGWLHVRLLDAGTAGWFVAVQCSCCCLWMGWRYSVSSSSFRASWSFILETFAGLSGNLSSAPPTGIRDLRTYRCHFSDVSCSNLLLAGSSGFTSCVAHEAEDAVRLDAGSKHGAEIVLLNE